jgi:hypothetical protein
LAACILSWAYYPVGIATITTVVYLIAYYYLVKHGYVAYRTFVPKDGSAFLEPLLEMAGLYQGSSQANNADGKDEQLVLAEKLSQAQEATKLKVKAILWKRQSIEDGGLFVKYYGVLEKGRLDLYYKEKDYRENLDPVNAKPIKLWQYNLESDHRKYAKNVTSLTTAMKSAMMGNEDFAMSDLLTSEHDLQFASRNFKFGLVPKVSSELMSSVVHEFLAHDEKSYKLWTQSLAQVVSAYDEIAAIPSVEQTIKIGSSDVEMVVQAANNK